MNELAAWLMKYWVLIVAVMGGATAIGSGYQRIETVEDALKQQVEIQKKIEDIKATQSRLDERTLMILNELRALRSE